MSSFVKLGDLTHIRTGKLDANASSENGQYPFFTCSKEPLRIASYSYDCECVLVAGNGDLNVKYYDGKFDAYQRTYIIESADKRKLLVKYLYFFLDIYVEVLRTQSIGGVIKYIKLGNLTDALIPLPSIERQAEIIECLEKCNTLIDKRQRQIALIEQTVKSRFIELFGDPIANPLGWPVKRLDDISVLITNGNTPKGGSDNYVSEGIVFLRSQNVWRNKIDLDDVAYIDAATHADMAKSSLHDKDILITKTGRINTENSSLGRAALFRGADNSANINGHVYLVRLDRTTVPEYVVAILTGEPYRRYIRKVCVGGIDKRQINLDQVEDFPIILPPIELQEQFAAFVEQTDKSKYYSSLSFRYCQAAANTYRQEWMTCRTSDF